VKGKGGVESLLYNVHYSTALGIANVLHLFAPTRLTHGSNVGSDGHGIRLWHVAALGRIVVAWFDDDRRNVCRCDG